MTQIAELIIAYTQRFAHLPTDDKFKEHCDKLLTLFRAQGINIAHIVDNHGTHWQHFFEELATNRLWQACYLSHFDHPHLPIKQDDKLLGMVYITPLGCFYQAFEQKLYQPQGTSAILMNGKPVLTKQHALQALLIKQLNTLHKNSILLPHDFEGTHGDTLLNKFITSQAPFTKLWLSVFAEHNIGFEQIFTLYEPVTPFYKRLQARQKQSDSPLMQSFHRLMGSTHQAMTSLAHLPFDSSPATSGTFLVAGVHNKENPIYGKHISITKFMSAEYGLLLNHQQACDLLKRVQKVEPAHDFAIFSLKSDFPA